MQRIYLSLTFLLLSVGLFAQTSLTWKNNALLPGDSFGAREFKYVDPGPAGPNQIWDFSKIQFTGKIPSVSVQDAPPQKIADMGDYRLVFNDKGYEYYCNSDENGTEEKGYSNKDTKISLSYSDPLVEMRFPLFYGHQYTDTYKGAGFYSSKSKIDVSGDFTVNADAFGTLILPDIVIKNVLRVTTIKKGLQTNMCGSTQISSTKYSWYAPGYRYPVLTICLVENRYRNPQPVLTLTAYENLQQPYYPGSFTGAGDKESIENGDFSVIIFPNPFSERLTYNYFLRKQLPVTIELYDMSGKYDVRILKTQIQGEGLHTGELNGFSYGLVPGVYYIRFTFDKQVVISKVVKI